MNDNGSSSQDKNEPETVDAKNLQAQQELSKIRAIITSEAFSNADIARKQDAQAYVGGVVSEALSQRDLHDNSVSAALLPIVERSIEKSISQHREKFVDYLYPLVGDLVRKFATSFVSDFIEKTNELLENSLSMKSIRWRYQAWRSGVNFSRYVASQVYTFQIHQILLIHKETGILLNSVSRLANHDENSDLVSSMLTAISDFVSDSFTRSTKLNNHLDNKAGSSEQDYRLAEIKAGEFTLYIKQGPKALLVAAVTGNISPLAKDKLQVTIESIHTHYLQHLQAFTGDTSLYEATTAQLNDCLLSEEKTLNKDEQNTKKPWLTIGLFTLLLAALSYYLFVNWQTNQLVAQIEALPTNQGIVVNTISVKGMKDVHIDLLRDPDAISTKKWIADSVDTIQTEWLTISEVPFPSLEETVVKARISALVARLNGEIQDGPLLQYSAANNVVSGQLSGRQLGRFTDALAKVSGLEQITPTVDITTANELSQDETSLLINQRALRLLSGDISQTQIEFGVSDASISAEQRIILQRVSRQYAQLTTLAEGADYAISLLVLGASDNAGNKQVNIALSIARAQNTASALVALGIPPDEIMTSGLGIIEDAPSNINVRKALIHVVLTKQ